MEQYLLKKYYTKENNLIKNDGKIDFESFMYFELEKNKIDCLEYPLFLGIKITNNCNMNCEHCFVDKAKNKIDLNMGDVSDIIKKLGNKKPYRIYLTGGEPFLNKDLIDIIKYIKKNEIKISIHTNGTLIDEKIAKKICEILEKDDYLQISMDGYDEETYFKARGNKNFKKVVEGIKNLVKNKIKTKINVVVTNVNINYIDKIYNFVNELGVSEVSFSPLINTKDNLNIFLPNDDEILYNFSNVLKLYYENNGIKIVQDPIAVPWGSKLLKKYFSNTNFVCPAARTTLEIDQNGNVYPCPYLHNEDFYMGNIFKSKYKDIWQSKKAENFRKKSKQINIECKECENNSLCKGACLADGYLNNKNHDSRCNNLMGSELKNVDK